MDRDIFFQPALTEQEVITMEICGEFFKLKDRDPSAYFYQNYPHFFPHLNDRTSFVRQAADLWPVKPAIQKRLVEVGQQAQSRIQPIDALPLYVSTHARAQQDKCFKFAADYGYCAAEPLHYYGFKMGLRVTLNGMITQYRLLAARAHDLWHHQSRIIRKVMAHTVGVFLDIKMRRPSLDSDGLLAV